jgi:hypothetical protein
MADPLNPRHTDKEILALILQRFPKLTREQALEREGAAGFDLDVPASTTQNGEQTPGGSTAKPLIVWPKGVKDVTSEKLGETLAIIGARRPAPAKGSD